MLRKILLISILVLAIGCSKSIKNGVYRGVISGEDREFIINNNKLEYVFVKNNKTNHYSKISDKNKNDKDIIYYMSEEEMVGGRGKFKVYIGIKQTNDNSLVAYANNTSEYMRNLRDFIISFSMGFGDANSFNAITTIYSIDINNPSILEKVEE